MLVDRFPAFRQRICERDIFSIGLVIQLIVPRAVYSPPGGMCRDLVAEFLGPEKKVAPLVQELQKTHSTDKRKMQEELVKLYQREGVNPLSGCLPILAQIPVFFAMYKVINVAIEMRHAPFFGWIKDLSAPDPTSIFNLYGALPYDLPAWLQIGVWPSLMFVLIMIQVRLSPPPQDKMFLVFFNYYYPVVVSFIMARFAAGLVIYWAFSSFLSIAQQVFIMRSQGVPIHLFERLSGRVDKNEQVPVVDVLEAEMGEAGSVEPKLPDQVKPKKNKKKKK